MTVSHTHPIKNAPLETHIEELSKNCGQDLKFHLVFVIPPEIFQSFTKQPYHSTTNHVIEYENLSEPVKKVEQYALELPLV